MEKPADAETGEYSRKTSTLDKHTDPFAEREGKTLLWKNVNMTLVSFDEEIVVDPVWFFVTDKRSHLFFLRNS